MRSRNDLAAVLRIPKLYGSTGILVDAEDMHIASEVAKSTARKLERNYHPGFGIFPSADPNSNYHNQVWARDLAHAGGNYFASANPTALRESIETIFRHQREDGSIPSRVEREYEMVRFIPLLRNWSVPIFNYLHGKGTERPVYEGQDGAGGEDTIPAVLIGVGELFIASEKDRQFVADHFDQFNRAADFFITKTDPSDGLAVMTRSSPDWADTIKRTGKLGGVNVWWARSLRLMEYMATDLGRLEDAKKYRKEARKVKNSVLRKLYNRTERYFQAEEHDARLDTVASIFGALYLLNASQAFQVEETLIKKVGAPIGLQNFAPPYPWIDLAWPRHLIPQQWRYHNKNVWPWVTCENIQVKIKIALRHPIERVRNQYKREAVADLVKMAQLFESKGAGEVFDPDVPEPAKTILYTPPKDFMGSMTAYQGAYLQLKRLGWI